MPDTPRLLAWHNIPALKAEVVARLKAHRERDELIQRTYQQFDPATPSGYRGCAIGCTLPYLPTNTDWHLEIEVRYGIPYAVAIDIDDIFERLPIAEAGEFAVAVIEAIPVGADLADVAEQGAGCYYVDHATAAGAAAQLIADLEAAPVPAAAP